MHGPRDLGLPPFVRQLPQPPWERSDLGMALGQTTCMPKETRQCDGVRGVLVHYASIRFLGNWGLWATDTLV